MTRSFAELPWDNTFSRLPEAFFQRITAIPLARPRLAAFNPDAAALLGLDPDDQHRTAFVGAINGDACVPACASLAAVYAGYQFGVWVPELGDGRAMLLGEVVGPDHRRWDVQVKGAGPTRFSRMGDGRAVLRSTIREYLASEAMHGLGIPTTRALAIVASDEPVYREQLERGALLVRLAPTHVRFGSFELFASRGAPELVARLADYVIESHFTQLLTLPAPERYTAWYREAVSRTARLMAAWTATGFSHGVMNTDNMSILGLTLDYGPFGWMERYDRGFIPNHSDAGGRYAFDQQPRIGLWNCARLGEALHTLVDESDALPALEGYRAEFENEMDRLMRAKLGLNSAEPDDVAMVADLLGILHDTRTDYTRFFRALSRYPASAGGDVHAEVSDRARLDTWLARYTQRLIREASDDAARHETMLRTNPKYILRNWMAQEAIEQAQRGSYERIDQLRELLAHPFEERPDEERCTASGTEDVPVSCSS